MTPYHEQVRARQDWRENADLDRLLSGLPQSLKSSLRRHWKQLRGESRDGTALSEANTFVREFAEQMKARGLPIASDDFDLGQLAKRQSQRLAVMYKHGAPVLDVLAEAGRFGIDLYPANMEEARALALRVCDEAWWRGRLKRKVTATVEHAHIRLRDVSRMADAYITDETNTLIRKRRERSAKALALAEATNETGYTATLAELAAKGMANRSNRRTELMVRVRGMEEIAKDLAWSGVFLTITAPSSFHSVKSNGRANPKYSGASPRDAQAHLCGVWARTRAQWKKGNVAPFGVRVVEPHHDGTPHWHVLLWAPADRITEVVDVVHAQALTVDGDEKGADKYRFKVEHIDPKKGSAVGYIAKYIAKNIDGFRVGDDLESGLSAEEGAARVSAWATCWRLRQFQTIGQPPVTIWRQLRRVPVEDSADSLLINDMHRAADIGDWSAFYKAHAALRKAGVFKVGFENANDVDKSTGEHITPLNKYGEAKRVIAAVVVRDAAGQIIERVQTRVHEWSVKWGRADLVSKTLARIEAGFSGLGFERSGEAASTRTRVNNCNRSPELERLQGEVAAANAAWEASLHIVQAHYEKIRGKHENTGSLATGDC
ncbi:hypothetical protein HNQ50_001393 [Silvimonas terrae]|uniref:Replication gene A protein-like domain-containing protein n=1 Tax=Silvimonas terrae TaxID=300266 RepID=A0A840REJ3_9NEIS|nr:replication endonuclease [Silvimonas terrae]MBB5190671.1 hypothetical protein [Silvimonas terrae]